MLTAVSPARPLPPQRHNRLRFCLRLQVFPAAGHIRAGRGAGTHQGDRASPPQLLPPPPPPRGLSPLLTSLPWTQEPQRLTGRMEAWSPQCRWSSPGAKGVMVGGVAPVLSEARGLGEPSRVGGYLMTLAERCVQGESKGRDLGRGQGLSEHMAGEMHRKSKSEQQRLRSSTGSLNR